MLELVPGWQEALQGMCEGEKWEIWMPYELGHGDRGAKDVPPFAPLAFEVSLHEVKHGKGRTRSGGELRRTCALGGANFDQGANFDARRALPCSRVLPMASSFSCGSAFEDDGHGSCTL